MPAMMEAATRSWAGVRKPPKNEPAVDDVLKLPRAPLWGFVDSAEHGLAARRRLANAGDWARGRGWGFSERGGGVRHRVRGEGREPRA